MNLRRPSFAPITSSPRAQIRRFMIYIGLAMASIATATYFSQIDLKSAYKDGFQSGIANTISAIFQLGEITLLDVPYADQQYVNSCEIASLRMVLKYKGVEPQFAPAIQDDMSLLQIVGYNPREKDIITNTWDDPQIQFVGYVDKVGKGYGVYGRPIARAAEALGRQTEYLTGAAIMPQKIAQEVRAGNPVIIWGNTSNSYPPYTWKTPVQTTVTAFKGEHARVVVGVIGATEQPTGFYVHDPITRENFKYWSARTFMDQMTSVPGVTDQAVVVR